MKTLIPILVLALSTIHASAIKIGDFAGSWQGERIETINGAGSYTSAKIIATKKNGGGLTVTETGESRQIGGYYTWKHTFKGDGKYQSALYYQGRILSTNSGSWKNSKGAIAISGTQRSGGSAVRFSGSLKLISGTQLTYKGDSGNVVVTITASRL